MKEFCTGIDKRGKSFFAAKVKMQSGRPSVELLTQSENFRSSLINNTDDSNLAWAVPDSDAIIKSLYLAETKSVDKRVAGRFELLQSLLNSEEEYVTTILPTTISNRFLGIAWHKDRLSSIRQTDRQQSESGISTFHSRAVALGRGFLGYCRTGDGELKAIVDIGINNVSICIIHNKQVIDIGCLSANDDLLSDDQSIDRFGLDLKTLLNFKLSLLAEDGITIPLSALIISGNGVDERVRNLLTTRFPVGVLGPDIHRGYFTFKTLDSTPYLSDFLVALGLAAN